MPTTMPWRQFAPAGRDQDGEREREADAHAPDQDRPQVAVGLAEGGADLDPLLARAGDGEREDAVEIEAGRRHGRHRQRQRNEDRPADDVELLAVQQVDFDVEHGRPDPHGRDDLHHGQAPVGDEELEALQQHDERADDEGQGCQPAPGAAQGQDGLLHFGVVAAADDVGEAEDGHAGATEDGRPGGGVGRGPGRRGRTRQGRRIGRWAGSGGASLVRCPPLLVVHRRCRPSPSPGHRARSLRSRHCGARRGLKKPRETGGGARA
jgi:hypothetical protein